MLWSSVLDNPVGQGVRREGRREERGGLSWSWPQPASRFQRCSEQSQQDLAGGCRGDGCPGLVCAASPGRAGGAQGAGAVLAQATAPDQPFAQG